LTQHFLSAEEIATQAGGAMPFLRAPRSELFADRALRLDALADGHALGDFLRFAALLAEEQAGALARLPPLRLPDARQLQRSREHGLPPLAYASHARDPLWRSGLRGLLTRLAARSQGQPRAVIMALLGQGDDFLEAQASKLLAGVMRGLDIAAAPLVAAGLQVYFTRLASSLPAASVVPIEPRTLCPCCGHRPVASVLRIGGADGGYRFLACALCGTEWHLVRISCAHCGGTKGIRYQALDDGTAPGKHAVQAEVCSECAHYCKICYQDRDPQVDPVADDLATLPLDILLGESGLEPVGVNYLLVHGDPQAAAGAAAEAGR
jgi:FdhE protein